MTTTEEKQGIIETPNVETTNTGNHNTDNQNNDKAKNNKQVERKARPGLKLLLIVGICTAFLIPLLLIRNLISERTSTESDAEKEVFEKWGGAQTIVGPFVEVTCSTDSISKDYVTMILMPEKLDVTGDVNTKALKRGIYDFTVYETSLDLTGQFKLPKDFDKNMRNKVWHFEDARVVVGIANLKGLRDNVQLNLAGTTYDMESCGDYGTGLTCPVNLASLLEGETLEFSLTIPFKGSGNLMFAPVGQTTSVNLKSDCTTPSFNGFYLPDDRQVSDTGFQASWKVLAVNRNYPQIMSRNIYDNNIIDESIFGVELKVPVEQYHQTDRAVKYAFLIILLTFAAVFFIEMSKAKPIHPVQYLLVGIALVVFYTLLLSFSEHFSFALSYFIASVMTIGLIMAFMASVTKEKKTAWGIGALLAVLYAFIYVLLQLENYALMVGSIGIFVVLGIAMFASQKIDWYKKKD